MTEAEAMLKYTICLLLTFVAVSAAARTAVVRLNAGARLATLMGASSGLEMLLTLTHL
jgi:hypothetical protein